MSDIKVVDQDGAEVTEQEVVPQTPNITTTPDSNEVYRTQIANLFDLQPKEVRSYKDKLNTLIEYAKFKTDDHSIDGIKWALRNLDLKLGTPPMGEKRLDYMYRFAYLEAEGRKINAEKEQFIKHGEE